MENQTAEILPFERKAKASKCTRPKRDLKGRGKHKDTYVTAQIPAFVMMSEDYRTLSLAGRALLNEFVFRFNGANNGDLSMPFSSVKDWGIRSEATLRKLLVELEAGGFLVKTRQGKGGSGGATPNLYAITWRPICNIRGKDDIKAGPASRTAADWKLATSYAGKG